MTPPSIPFQSAFEPKNLIVKDLKEKKQAPGIIQNPFHDT